jgi:hypothetical protein
VQQNGVNLFCSAIFNELSRKGIANINLSSKSFKNDDYFDEIIPIHYKSFNVSLLEVSSDFCI